MKNSVRLALCALVCLAIGSVSVNAQNISTVAGGGPTTVAPGVTATAFSVGAPAAARKDGLGNTYVLDNAFNHVYKVDSTGKMTLFAGNGTVGFSGEAGPAAAAAMNGPSGLCIDSQNNVYVADSDNAVIREIVVTAAAGKTVGNIYTVAGQHETSFSWGGDGDVATAGTVHLHFPDGCSFDSKGNMYIADRGNNEIRVVIGEGFSATPGNPIGVTGTAGHIYLFAGSTGTVAPGPPAGGYGANGSLAQGAAVYGPFDVFVDSHDNVFYADLGNNFPDGGAPNSDHTIPFNNNVIREVPATAQTVPFAMAAGAVYTVAGVPGVAGVGFTTSTTGNPVVATAALLQQPRGISVDTAGNLFFADNGNQVIREVPAPGGSLTAGNIYVAAGVAGSRGFAGEGGLADAASLNFPAGTYVDSTGDLYIADQTNDRVRKVVSTGGGVYSNGTITTFAGNGSTSFGVSTPTLSQMNVVEGVAVDAKTGNLVIADVGILSDDQSVIRGVPPPIATSALGLYLGVVGNNNFSNTAPIAVNNALNMTFDKAGNAYIADTGNCIIRKFSGGVITTIAGVEPTTPDPSHPEATVPQCGAGSSGGVATATKLGFGTDTSVTPTAILGASGVAVDSHGNVFFSDAVNNVVYEVPAAPSADGTKLAGHAYVIAGSTAGFSGDGGAAAGAQFNRPQGLYIDIYDNLYIADSKNNVIREIPAVTVTTPVPMTAGNIYTVAGKQSAGAGYSGNNGLATNAQLNNPFMIAVDNAMSIFIADTSNHVIRQVAGVGVSGETQGNIYLVAGNNVPGFKGDGGLAGSGNSQINQPKGLAIDASGNLLIGDSQNLRVRSVAAIANVSPVALASLSPNPVTFIAVAGTSSPASVVTLTNGGGATLTITGPVSISGTNASDFTETDNCTTPGTVAGGATCTINVIFAPPTGATGARTATLTVTDNAFGGSQAVTLNGTVGNPVLTLTVTDTDPSSTQTVTAGATATYNLSVAANQAVNATITCTGAPTDATCTPAPASVAVTATTAGTLKVSVTTTARGELLPFNQPSMKMQPPSFLQIAPMASLALLFLLAMMLGWMQNQPGRMRLARVALSLCLILMPIAAATFLVGCGGGSSTTPPPPPPATGTPAGTYTITVTATSGSTTSTPLKLTLIVN